MTAGASARDTEPHRLSLDEMECTTMPAAAEALADRWEPTADEVPDVQAALAGASHGGG